MPLPTALLALAILAEAGSPKQSLHHLSPGAQVAVERSLSRAGLPAGAGDRPLRSGLAALSERLLADEDSPADLQALHRRIEAVDDLFLANWALERPLPRETMSRLSRRRSADSLAARALHEALIQAALERVAAGAARWQGRTAVVEAPGGDALALKFRRDAEDDFDLEGARMRTAARLGLAAPRPLERSSGRYAAAAPRGEVFSYLLPAELSGPFQSYLNASSVSGLGADERGRELRAAALRAVDDMAALRRAGYAHSSLAPLSHSEAAWSWDFWRWTTHPVMRHLFGPTAIHNPGAGLSYPNLRMSGLADFAHVRKLSEMPALASLIIKDGRPDRFEGFSRRGIAGQNLTEWSLIVSDAWLGAGLPRGRLGPLLAEGIERYAARSGLEAGDRRALTRAASATARALALWHALDRTLPPRLRDFLNRRLSRMANREITAGERLMIPPQALDPLVTRVLWPLVDALAGDRHDPRRRFAPTEQGRLTAPIRRSPYADMLSEYMESDLPAATLTLMAVIVGGIILFGVSAAVGGPEMVPVNALPPMIFATMLASAALVVGFAVNALRNAFALRADLRRRPWVLPSSPRAD